MHCPRMVSVPSCVVMYCHRTVSVPPRVVMHCPCMVSVSSRVVMYCHRTESDPPSCCNALSLYSISPASCYNVLLSYSVSHPRVVMYCHHTVSIPPRVVMHFHRTTSVPCTNGHDSLHHKICSILKISANKNCVLDIVSSMVRTFHVFLPLNNLPRFTDTSGPLIYNIFCKLSSNTVKCTSGTFLLIDYLTTSHILQASIYNPDIKT